MFALIRFARFVTAYDELHDGSFDAFVCTSLASNFDPGLRLRGSAMGGGTQSESDQKARCIVEPDCELKPLLGIFIGVRSRRFAEYLWVKSIIGLIHIQRGKRSKYRLDLAQRTKMVWQGISISPEFQDRLGAGLVSQPLGFSGSLFGSVNPLRDVM
ncbi:hypothetical protein CKO20_10315 [Rhodocyclus tenuis]|nr:hypothetical protein [Rhodocyclus tenuis]